MRVEDAVAVVTGGASGLGEGAVRMLVERGARAAMLDLPGGRGEQLAQELGDRALFVPVDVTRSEEVSAAVEKVVAEFGSVNVCVNAAGISPAHRVVAKDGTLFPLEVFRRTLEVNLIGLFDVVRHCAARMAENEPGPSGERGVVVNVGSIAAMEGQTGQAAYAASKGGVVSLTITLARDLAALGIRVVAVCPGIMATPMLAGIDDRRREALVDLHVFPKRLGTPADFAHLLGAILEAELLNGEVIRLDAATRL